MWHGRSPHRIPVTHRDGFWHRNTYDVMTANNGTEAADFIFRKINGRRLWKKAVHTFAVYLNARRLCVWIQCSALALEIAPRWKWKKPLWERLNIEIDLLFSDALAQRARGCRGRSEVENHFPARCFSGRRKTRFKGFEGRIRAKSPPHKSHLIIVCAC